MNPSPKVRYRVTNWPEYNRSLCARASLTIWFDPQMTWYAPQTGHRGRHPTFSNAAIQCCLTLGNLFQLPLRQTTGLVSSLLQMLGLKYACPDFSTLSRRQRTLSLPPLGRLRGQPMRLLVDSTGIKECGPGEWLRQQHRDKRRRSWIKVHLAVDAQTMTIEAMLTTAGNQMDAAQLPGLLKQVPGPVGQLYGDGAYDTHATYRLLKRKQIKPVIRVRLNAVIHEDEGLSVRNEAIRQVQQLSLKGWQQSSGYHLRSLVESKMRCLKQLGERVSARVFESQQVQMHLRGLILNQFMQLGRCHTVRVS